MNKKLFSIAFALLMFPSLSESSDNSKKRENVSAHVHGIGSLSVALDVTASALEMEYVLPAFDVLGFEHKPTSKEDKIKYEEVKNQLKNPLNVFQLVVKDSEKKAGCQMSSGTIEAPYQESHKTHKHKHHDHHGHHEHEKGHSDHQDYKLKYSFKCVNVEQLKGVKTLLFDQFPSLKKLQVVLLDSNGATPYELNAKTSTVYFGLKK